jgi:hypothetical protein
MVVGAEQGVRRGAAVASTALTQYVIPSVKRKGSEARGELLFLCIGGVCVVGEGWYWVGRCRM